MKILVINGPNLNLIKFRCENHYGNMTISEINAKLVEFNNEIDFEFYQSNYEGDIICKIQSLIDSGFDALIINPAAYSHYSIAILDALLLIDIIKVEVHLSKISSREQFRRKSITSLGCNKVFEGEKFLSYQNAVEYIKKQFPN